MPSRVNEVQFGLVPGLADLAEKLSNAFAKKRSREMDFEIAKLEDRKDQRKEQAAQLEAQRKAEEKAEKKRRDDLQDQIKRAGQLRSDQVGLSTPQGTSHNPTEAEKLKFSGLDSQNPNELQQGQNQLRIARQLEDMSKLAGKTGNEDQAQKLLGINQLLAGGNLTLEDLQLRLGDDEPLTDNLGHNIMGNQPELTSESRAVAGRLNEADLSHLTPEEQAAVRAKGQGLTAELPPDTFQPGDIEKQLQRLELLGESRRIMSQAAGDYIADKTGLNLSNAERDQIDEVMQQVDDQTQLEFPADSGDPTIDREDLADQQIAAAAVRAEVATIMAENKVGIYDALEIYSPGQALGRQLRNEAMNDKYNTPMTAGKQNLYNKFRSAVDRRSDLTPRQKEAFSMIKTIETSLPDHAVNTLVKAKDLPTFNSIITQLTRGTIKGFRQQDTIQKLDQGKADSLAEVYNDLSLEADQFGGALNEEQSQNLLMATFGFPAEAQAAKQIADSNMRIQEQERFNRQQAEEAKRRTQRNFVPSAFDDATQSDAELIRRGQANNEFR